MAKKGKSQRPPWFTNKLCWVDFTSPSYASLEDNVDVIRGIFDFYNLNVKTHCKFPVMPAEVQEEEQVDGELAEQVENQMEEQEEQERVEQEEQERREEERVRRERERMEQVRKEPVSYTHLTLPTKRIV